MSLKEVLRGILGCTAGIGAGAGVLFGILGLCRGLIEINDYVTYTETKLEIRECYSFLVIK